MEPVVLIPSTEMADQCGNLCGSVSQEEFSFSMKFCLQLQTACSRPLCLQASGIV